MILKKNQRIEAATSGDFTRVHLHHVTLVRHEGERGELIASDGHMLASVPVQLDSHDTEGPVTSAALKLARKSAGRGTEASLLVNGSQVVPGAGVAIERPPVMPGPLPTWRGSLMPSGDHTYQVGVNADLLRKACDALGTTEVIMTFRGPLDPIIVTPRPGSDVEPGSVALIMPMRV